MFEGKTLRFGVAPTCAALGLPRATYYRRRRPPRVVPPRPPAPRALGEAERAVVLEHLHAPRFVDLAQSEVYATLLDEGRYLCSERTMYRLLAAHDEVRERRNQRRHPQYAAPELLARRPNELWSWDITKLLGPAKWTYFYLYVMLDVFSRYVVGWMVAHRESAGKAEDATITTKVKTKLTTDRVKNLVSVNVDTTDGVVHLKGTVPNEQAKGEAERLAKDTDGVVSVMNDLKISPPKK